MVEKWEFMLRNIIYYNTALVPYLVTLPLESCTDTVPDIRASSPWKNATTWQTPRDREDDWLNKQHDSAKLEVDYLF